MHKNTTPLKAVIFDAANTILENVSGYSPRKEACRILNLSSESEIRNLIYTISADYPGISYKQFVDALVKRTKGTSNDDLSRQLTQVWMRNNNEMRLREDALYVLQILRKRGFKLALLPNCTPFAVLLHKNLQLERYFDTLVHSCEVGLLKPDPRIFWKVTSELAIEPEEACMVGDKVKTDILGATLAKCVPILFDERNKQVIMDSRLPIYASVGSLSDLLKLPILRVNE